MRPRHGVGVDQREGPLEEPAALQSSGHTPSKLWDFEVGFPGGASEGMLLHHPGSSPLLSCHSAQPQLPRTSHIPRSPCGYLGVPLNDWGNSCVTSGYWLLPMTSCPLCSLPGFSFPNAISPVFSFLKHSQWSYGFWDVIFNLKWEWEALLTSLAFLTQ